MADNGIAKFVDLMRDLIKEEIDKTDSTVVCKVVAKNRFDTHDYRYDVCIEPDENNTIKNIQNASNSDIVPGDYVYVYKINNQLNNCFIFKKIGGTGASSYISILEDKISTMVTRNDFSTSITQTAEEIRLKASKEDMESEISQKADEIYAEVVKKTDANEATGFGWSITVEDGFRVYKTTDGQEVNIINATSSGLKVTGEITATTGYIGNGTDGFTIHDTYIVNGSFTEYDDKDPTHDGVYIGTDGIRLGKAFKVDRNGNVVASTLKTIASVTMKYGVSKSAEVQPTEWADTITSLRPEDGDYIWSWKQTVYTTSTDGKPDTDNEYSVSRIGKNGSSVEIKGTVANYTALLALTSMRVGDGYIVQDASDDKSLPEDAVKSGVLYTYDGVNWVYCGQITGPKGETGYSIVATFTRNSLTDAEWKQRYEDNKNEYTWNDTSLIRNGCRVGDLFTVTGTSTDSGTAYTLTYTSTTSTGNLTGVCKAYSLAEPGAPGNGISNMIVKYAKSDQGTDPAQIPSAEWKDDIPNVAPGQYLWQRTTIVFSDGITDNQVSYNVTLYGETGPIGYSIVTSLQKDDFTEENWNLYGTINREETWTGTETLRNGCRIGDLFTVVGCAKDSGRGHTITYRSNTAAGDLRGVCIAHQSTERGNGVSSSVIKYTKSNQGINPPDPLSGGWQDNIPSVDPGEYLWSKTTIITTDGKELNPTYTVSYIAADGSPASVTFENVCTALGIGTTAVNNKGIYNPNDTDLLINATAIKTGLLQVGEGTQASPIKFLANITSETVTIGGFSVGANSLNTNGAGVGDANSVFVSNGITSNVSIGGSGNISRNWAFISGNTFGVTTAGEIFATYGQIGGFTITDTSIQYGTEDFDGSIILNTRARLHAYRSTNNGVNSSQSIMCFTYNGPATDLTVYIRSYAESNYDYTIISEPNPANIPVSYSSGSTEAHTRGHQQSGHALSDYTAVQYTFLADTEYKIYVIFVKDSSQNRDDDRGYVLIPESDYITIDLSPDTTGASFDPNTITINKYPFELYESYSLSDPSVIAPHFKLGTGFKVDGTGALSIGTEFSVSSLGEVSINGGSIRLGTGSDAFSVNSEGQMNAYTVQCNYLENAEVLYTKELNVIGGNLSVTNGIITTPRIDVGDNDFEQVGQSLTEKKTCYFTFQYVGDSYNDQYHVLEYDFFSKDADGKLLATPAGRSINLTMKVWYRNSFGKNIMKTVRGTMPGGQSSVRVSVTFDKTDTVMPPSSGSCTPASQELTYITSQSGMGTNAAFFSSTSDSTADLGRSENRWKDIYATGDVIQISDRTAKNNISYYLDTYDAFFDALKPASFKLNQGESNRTHLGFISQDIEESLNDVGLTSLDFAGFIKSPMLDENDKEIPGQYNYGLRYGEFHALEVYEIQQLKARVIELEQKIIDLTNNSEVKGDK